MRGPRPLDGATVAFGKLCGLGDALSRLAQCDDASVLRIVAFAASAAPLHLRQGYPLTLTFAAIGIVIVRHLQRDLQQHVLNRFKNDAGDAFGIGREVG